MSTHKLVHKGNSTIYNSQKVKQPQYIPTNTQMDEQTVVYLYNETLFNHLKNEILIQVQHR